MPDIITSNTPLFLTGVFVFGLLVGSFLNVVILRLPIRLQRDWRRQCQELLETEGTEEDAVSGSPGLPADLIWSRSRCPRCGHPISAVENIPLLSYLFLRGRCSACKTRISLRYPLVEATTACMFLLAALVYGPTLQALPAIVLTGLLIALAGIDIDHQLLPDDLTYFVLWSGLFLSLFNVFCDPVSSITGALAGYLSLWTIYHLFRLLTGKEGMGYGDFKLLAALGAWTGWQMLPLIILLSSLVGAVTGVTMILFKRHRSNQPLPFGPFIAMAGWIALLWGDKIVNAYLRSSGLGRY
jgi:leader peptidase (prepilin peptidase)/N-methyltransferase